MHTLRQSWWLLALAGVFNAAFAFANLVMAGQDGFLGFQRFGPSPWDMALLMSWVALAAGVCTIAAAIAGWRKSRSWMLALNGLAFTAFGMLPFLLRTDRSISFRWISLLFVTMALTLGVFALQNLPKGWLQGLAPVVAVASAGVFLALGFRWIRLVLPYTFFVWMAAYFAFSALCLVTLALRQKSQPALQTL